MSGQIAEGVTNEVTNPSFESDTTLWSANTATFDLSTDYAKVGDKSLKVELSSDVSVVGGVYTAAISTDATGISTDEWTGSAHIYVPSTAAPAEFTMYNIQDGGSDAQTSTGNTNWAGLAAGWNYIYNTATLESTDRTDQYLAIYMHGTSDNYYYLDAVQLENRSYPTPYCDGDLGDGHIWSGTSDASASIRGNQILSYGVGSSGSTDAVMNEETGGFACRVSFPAMESGINNRVFRWWDSSDGDAIYMNLDSVGVLTAVMYTTDVEQVSLTYDASVWEDHTWYHVAMTWEANDVRLYINGEQDTQDVSAAMPTIESTVIHIGESTDAEPMNGWMDELAIFAYAPSAFQIWELYNSNKAGVDDQGWVHDSLWYGMIYPYLAAGTVVLSGAYSMWLDLSMFVSGLLELTGIPSPIAMWKRFFSGVVELVDSFEFTVYYDQVVAGLITFSSRFAKPLGVFGAILGQIRLAMGLVATEQPVKSQIVLGLTETDGSPLSADVEIDAN